MSQTLWYFAYGSNVQRATFYERRRMSPLAVLWGWLEDHRLCFDIPIGPGERGVANIAPAAGDRVCGVLYLLTAAEFDRLDATEGVGMGLYRREPVEIVTGRGEQLAAHAYRSSISDPERKPSPRYLGLILDGAREHGLPDEWVRTLSSFPLAQDERQEDRTDDWTSARAPGPHRR